MPSTQTHREILTILMPLRNYLHQEYRERLDRIILFGSQARGDATAESDIDVLIVLQDPVDISLELNRTSHFIGHTHQPVSAMDTDGQSPQRLCLD